MARKNFTKAVIAERFAFAKGCCEECHVSLKPGAYHCDHDDPDGLTGQPTFDNARILCIPCHKEKTRLDVANIAEAKRRAAVASGADRVAKRQSPSARPLPSRPKEARRKLARIEKTAMRGMSELHRRFGNVDQNEM